MSTWNRKSRAEMAELQNGLAKRQVFCRKCDKVHDHPVHDGSHRQWQQDGRIIAVKCEKDAKKRKDRAHAEHLRNINRKRREEIMSAR